PKAQKADLPYRGTKKSDSKTDFRFVFSDPETLGYTTVSKIDSNFRYYSHPGFEISRHRLLKILNDFPLLCYKSSVFGVFRPFFVVFLILRLRSSMSKNE